MTALEILRTSLVTVSLMSSLLKMNGLPTLTYLKDIRVFEVRSVLLVVEAGVETPPALFAVLFLVMPELNYKSELVRDTIGVV